MPQTTPLTPTFWVTMARGHHPSPPSPMCSICPKPSPPWLSFGFLTQTCPSPHVCECTMPPPPPSHSPPPPTPSPHHCVLPFNIAPPKPSPHGSVFVFCVPKPYPRTCQRTGTPTNTTGIKNPHPVTATLSPHIQI